MDLWPSITLSLTGNFFMLQKLRIDPFLPGLVLMILLGWRIPIQEVLDPNIVSKIVYYGIAGIFLLYGIKLDLSQIRRDLGHWKLHLLIQGTTFLLFPLLILALLPVFEQLGKNEIWLGLFYLAVLPSTVSYSVMMTSLARGNVTSSIFNASISGIIGIFLTPLWMNAFVNRSGESMDLSGVIVDLLLQILLPVILGILLQPLLRSRILRQKKIWSWFDKLIIWLIVYKSFSAGFASGLTQVLSPIESIGLLFLAAVLFLLVFEGLKFSGKKLQFNAEDRITLSMNGSMKSLVHGSAMAAILFTEQAASIMLIPVMFYHGFVLFYTGYVAKKWSKRASTIS
jgi:sodium/bile acid cotransporter 7